MRLATTIFLFICSPVLQAGVLDDFLFGRHYGPEIHLSLPAPPAAPWIDDAELRLSPERDVNNLSSETYRFRFRPTSRGERRAMRDLFRMENDMAALKWQEALSDATARRYHAVIDLAVEEVQFALLERRLELDRSRLEAVQALAASDRFDAVDLQDALLRIERRQLDVSHALAKVEALRAATINSFLAVDEGDAPSLSSRLIAPQAVNDRLVEIAASAASSPRTAEQLALRLAEGEVALEQSRARFGINLLELGFEDKRTDSYNVTLGFRIPLGRDDYGLKKRLREANEARQHAFLAERVLEEKADAYIQELRWALDVHKIEQAALVSTRQRIHSYSGDITALVALREYELELADTVTAAHARVLRNYVNLLDLLGMLHEEPRTNWIAGDEARYSMSRASIMKVARSL